MFLFLFFRFLFRFGFEELFPACFVSAVCFLLITTALPQSSSLESLDESLEELDSALFMGVGSVLGFSANLVCSPSDSELDEESLEMSAGTAAPLVFPELALT